MEPTPRLRQEQRDSLAAESQSGHSELSATSSAVVFDTPEDLLRQDRIGISVPAGVEQRLESSLQAEPRPAGDLPWWRRWLGGSRFPGNPHGK